MKITLEAKSSVQLDQNGSEHYQEYLEGREDDETEDDGVEDETANHRERVRSTDTDAASGSAVSWSLEIVSECARE